MGFYRVQIDVIVRAADATSAADDVNQLMDMIPEPDPPIVSIYRAPTVEKVNRGDGADQWVVVSAEDQPLA